MQVNQTRKCIWLASSTSGEDKANNRNPPQLKRNRFSGSNLRCTALTPRSFSAHHGCVWCVDGCWWLLGRTCPRLGAPKIAPWWAYSVLKVHWRADCACEPPAPSKQVRESDDTSPVPSSPVGTWDAAMDALDEMRCDLACPPSPLQGKWGKGPPCPGHVHVFSNHPSIHPRAHVDLPPVTPLPSIITARPRRRAGATPKNWTLEAQITLPSS
ncbi:hypothetical protein K456DRAFT_1936060 [Colletotrichum gloeosporioides 23]|nr:hypothetical protein K456DRAFT_1936060 [Colletotrichum gloeosporioides 23]